MDVLDNLNYDTNSLDKVLKQRITESTIIAEEEKR